MKGSRSPRISRRALLEGTAAITACASVPLALKAAARAQSTKAARKLVIVLASGGWDTTYALDPKPGVPSIDVPEGAIEQHGEIAIWSHASRPSVSDFFTRYGERTVVLNGVQVRSFVHPDCLKRVLTGGPSETAPDMAAIAAFERGRELPVPYLALGGQARSGPYAAITGRTGTTNQLAALIDPTAAYASPTSIFPETGLVASEDERALVRGYLEASAERLRATRGQNGYNKRRIDDFVASLDRAERLRGFARTSGVGERDYTLDLETQIPLAVRALSEDLSCTALMQLDNWDTHQGNARQGSLHESLFGALSTLMHAIEQASIADETLVLVLSEMGRTPKLNADNGKDHWPVTSALLLGAGVRGGRVLGGSSDELDALPIDLETGAVDSAGTQLQASHLVAGVLDALGVDSEQYLPSVTPFRAFQA